MVEDNVSTFLCVPKQAGNDVGANLPVGIELAMGEGVTCPEERRLKPSSGIP
jgi:hypothetical protein